MLQRDRVDCCRRAVETLRLRTADVAAIQIVRGRAQTLKTILKSFCPLLNDQNEMTAASSATVRVPAAGPKSITDVKTNVSETERATGIEYSRIGAEPLTTVSTAKNQPLVRDESLDQIGKRNRDTTRAREDDREQVGPMRSGNRRESLWCHKNRKAMEFVSMAQTTP